MRAVFVAVTCVVPMSYEFSGRFQVSENRLTGGVLML